MDSALGEAARAAAAVAISAAAVSSVYLAVNGDRCESDKKGDIGEKFGELEIPREMEEECSKFRSMRDDFLAALEGENMEEADEKFSGLVDYYVSEIRDRIDGRENIGLRLIAREMQESFIAYADKIKEIGDVKRALEVYDSGEDLFRETEMVGRGVKLEKAFTLLAMARSAGDVREVIKNIGVVRSMPGTFNANLTSDAHICDMLAHAILLNMDPADREGLEEELVECQYAVLKENNTWEASQAAMSVYMAGGAEAALVTLGGNGEGRRLLKAVELHACGKISEALTIYDELFDYQQHPLALVAARLAKIAEEQLRFGGRKQPVMEDIARK